MASIFEEELYRDIECFSEDSEDDTVRAMQESEFQ